MIGLPRVRPRFRIDDERDADAVLAVILAHAERTDDVVLLRTTGHHLELSVPAAERRFWSPCLSVEVETVPEPGDAGPVAAGRPGAYGGAAATAHPGGTPGASIVRGLVGPRPEVWTMFAAIHALLLFVAVTALMIGAAQATLGESLAILWWCPISLSLMAGLYAGSQLGQHLADDQTTRLREFLHEAVPGAQKDRPMAAAVD